LPVMQFCPREQSSFCLSKAWNYNEVRYLLSPKNLKTYCRSPSVEYFRPMEGSVLSSFAYGSLTSSCALGFLNLQRVMPAAASQDRGDEDCRCFAPSRRLSCLEGCSVTRKKLGDVPCHRGFCNFTHRVP
jgi:hypothetical protein